jgi:hypothetical protein
MKLTRSLFNLWYRITPKTAARWLNRRLERAEQADTWRRDAQAADELELQCEEAGLPIHTQAITELKITILPDDTKWTSGTDVTDPLAKELAAIYYPKTNDA